jgi:alkylation response protein AidB-like acyl-CoA dehydrogenase
MQLEPRTDPGGRFVAGVESHVATFRARASGHDAAGTFPSGNFEDLVKSGALAAFVPEELGGLGLESVHDWAVGLERLGRGDASTAIALNMHLAVSRNLAGAWRGARASGDAAASERNGGMLRAIAAGQLVICATATEAGTDFLRPLTTATRSDDSWTIDGRKIFVTLSPVANLYALNVRVVDPGAGEPDGDRLGFAFVPAGTPGLAPQGDWDALGMRASGSQSIVLDGCRVPEGAVQIAGEWGRWNPGVLMGRTLGNVTLVGVFLGIAERARELAVEGARTQTKPKYAGAIAQASGVQHLLGEIDIDLAAARAVLGEVARRLDRLLAETAGASPSLEVAHACMADYQCAKWIVNQNAIRIVSRAMDVCGGGAFMSRHELSRLYRDVRAGPFMQPFSPTEAREYVGRIALGLYPEG